MHHEDKIAETPDTKKKRNMDSYIVSTPSKRKKLTYHDAYLSSDEDTDFIGKSTAPLCLSFEDKKEIEEILTEDKDMVDLIPFMYPLKEVQRRQERRELAEEKLRDELQIIKDKVEFNQFQADLLIIKCKYT